MKKFAAITAALGFAALLSTSALAAGPAAGGGPGMGYGYHRGYANLTAEQQAEVDQARATFLNDTLKLRQEIAAKRAELGTLYAQPNPDQAKIKALSDEMVDLHAQLAKKRNEYVAKLPAGTFRGMGGGRGMGFGGGMGGGFGGGMGGGNGACWR